MPIKVAVFNRDHSCHPGGDAVHIAELSKALRDWGVERCYYPDGRGFCGNADLIHIYHINFTWCRMGFGVAEQYPHIPYVVNPIFYESEGFGVPFTEMLGWLQRSSAVQIYSGAGEAALRCCTRYQGPVSRIPPGVGPEFIEYGDPMKREGVIAVAARFGDKNTNKVNSACVRLGIPFRVVSNVPREAMPSVYKSARLFVNASHSETFGLTILEALAAGCRVLASRGCQAAFEWLPGLHPVDPLCQIEEMRDAVDWAYNTPDWNYVPNILARERTWSTEAEQIANLYTEILEYRKGANELDSNARA